jgi:anaerobic nitric oxide reductase transcription regulator
VADLDLPGSRAVSAVAANQPAAENSPASGELRPAVDVYQRQLISACLQRQQGNWAAAARELGLDRANLNRLALRLGLK